MKQSARCAIFLVPILLQLGWAGESPKSQESYIKKAEGEVQEWTIKLKNLQDRSEKSGAKSRAELDKQLKIVNDKLESVRKDLDQLRVSSGSSWVKIRQGLEDAMRDLKRDYRKATSFFDKTESKEKS
jgi:hypothetical protein